MSLFKKMFEAEQAKVEDVKNKEVVIISQKDTRSWAFTLKVLHNRVDEIFEDDYVPFFKKLVKAKCILDFNVYEHDSRGKMHIHGIFTCPRNYYVKRLAVPGLSHKFVEVYDYDGWKKYCHKDCDLPYE